VQRLVLVSILLVPVVMAGCGSSGRTARATSATQQTQTAAPIQTTSGTRTANTTTPTTDPGALQAEANSGAAGDIPDNQVFLVFHSGAGYTIKYPEGWAQGGTSRSVVFRDKNNVVRIVVASGRAPTLAAVRSDLRRLRAVHILKPPAAITLSGHVALKVVYATVSAPNPVTGKRVTLVVDRYYVWTNRRHAVVDLGTPEGVDNVDAYRLIVESFRWR
jgi:hypothetical protein